MLERHGTSVAIRIQLRSLRELVLLLETRLCARSLCLVHVSEGDRFFGVKVVMSWYKVNQRIEIMGYLSDLREGRNAYNSHCPALGGSRPGQGLGTAGAECR
jgi:hypothetical protein